MPRMEPGSSEPASPQLNATAAALLGLLLEEPRTGWDLMAVAQERIGEFWTLTQSQVYRELSAMAGRGLVEAGPVGPRDRKPYRATASGRAAFDAWVQGDPGPDHVRIPLLLTLAFAGHLPAGRLTQIVEAQRSVHQERLDRYRAARQALAAAPGAPAARVATLEFGLRHEQAVLDWFDALPGILGSHP
jgi:DNA-binding PadR family transcriptional regulator